MMTFTEAIAPVNQQSHYCSKNSLPRLQVTDQFGNTFSCQELGCEVTDLKLDGFSIRFNSQFNIAYGTAVLYKDDCFVITSNKTHSQFTDYPQKALVGMIGPPTATQKAGDTLAKMYFYLGWLANLFLMYSSPSSAVQTDYVGVQLALLLMLSGPPVKLPDRLLRATIDLSRPLQTGNPFARWTADERCRLPEAFARNDLVCSIFGN